MKNYLMLQNASFELLLLLSYYGKTNRCSLSRLGLKKYDYIWNKVIHGIKELDKEPICNKKVLKTKVKSYGDEATDFNDEEMS